MDDHVILLNDGNSLPKIGFGVYLIQEQQMLEAVRAAYRTGYRLFDTASFYENEEFLGQAIRQLGIPRDEIQIATKAWTTELGYEEVKEALRRSLARLQTDYVDVYLIHWPLRDEKKLSETWTAMEEIKDKGFVRSIGVCNFKQHHLKVIHKGHRYVPAINQIERHPLLTQQDLVAYDRSHRIATQAWSPLMRGRKVMDLELIRSLAEKYGKTPAQIVLNWDIREGVIPIPKSVTPSRISENFHALDFSLSEEDVRSIDALNADLRSGADPDAYAFEPKN